MRQYGLYEAEGADVIIVGGGHAGCEAALACARMGVNTLMLALNLDSIAMMPCNPNIGGTSKGHLVKEIDALGGEMGKNIDKTFIQSRMLNTSKGPAVFSLRAQADKNLYARQMKHTLENTSNLRIKQADVVDIVFENDKAEKRLCGIITAAGAFHSAKAVVLCTGTYGNARCLYGEAIAESGPNGLSASVLLSQSLKRLGIPLMRFKTGTPARIDGRTVDYSKMDEQKGDEVIVSFSFENEELSIEKVQISCWLTYTTEQTHKIIRDNLHRSPMYSGVIEGTGTRYCPSIEDKVVRFADKDRHQIFVEPEGLDTNEMYVAGLSTSLPLDVQVAMYRSVIGLENCEIMRPGYAIEYDCIDATNLTLALEFKTLPGLYSAGQFNGSSGYEEAAAQGLVAGINAALKVMQKPPMTIGRDQGYIGVLIDDLVVKGTKEPYRMMTSRAEYRLLLRQDNADLRLTEKGYEAGLVKEEANARAKQKKELIKAEIDRLSKITIAPSNEINEFLSKRGSSPLQTGMKITDLIKRPELDYEELHLFDVERPELPSQVKNQVNIEIKYEGYIKKQIQQVEQFRKLESKLIPDDMDYNSIPNLRLEARQKLTAIRPVNLGQAARITGVSPADITYLMMRLN